MLIVADPVELTDVCHLCERRFPPPTTASPRDHLDAAQRVAATVMDRHMPISHDVWRSKEHRGRTRKMQELARRKFHRVPSKSPAVVAIRQRPESSNAQPISAQWTQPMPEDRKNTHRASFGSCPGAGSRTMPGHEIADRRDAPVGRRPAGRRYPGNRRSAIIVGIEARASTQNPKDRLTESRAFVD
jgi:hypothetical protein